MAAARITAPPDVAEVAGDGDDHSFGATTTGRRGAVEEVHELERAELLGAHLTLAKREPTTRAQAATGPQDGVLQGRADLGQGRVTEVHVFIGGEADRRGHELLFIDLNQLRDAVSDVADRRRGDA